MAGRRKQFFVKVGRLSSNLESRSRKGGPEHNSKESKYKQSIKSIYYFEHSIEHIATDRKVEEGVEGSTKACKPKVWRAHGTHVDGPKTAECACSRSLHICTATKNFACPSVEIGFASSPNNNSLLYLKGDLIAREPVFT
jgi:hypothetical protein